MSEQSSAIEDRPTFVSSGGGGGSVTMMMVFVWGGRVYWMKRKGARNVHKILWSKLLEKVISLVKQRLVDSLINDTYLIICCLIVLCWLIREDDLRLFFNGERSREGLMLDL